MKKFFLILTLIVLSFSAFASDIKLCEKETRIQIKEEGFNTKRPLRKQEAQLLEAGQSLSPYNKTLGPYSENKLVYFFESTEFGGFEVAAIVNPSNCKMDELVVLRAE